MTAQKKPAGKPESGAANDYPEGQEQEQKTYSAIDEAIQQEQEDAKEGEWQAGGEAANDDGAEKIGVQEIQALLQMGFSVVGARYGAHWNLSQPEAKGLAESTDRALKHYLGDVEMGPGAALAVTAGMIVLPRAVITIQQANQEPEKPEENQEKTEGGTGGD
ncbi:MAG: hypothetical protein CMP77_02000 [Flavobacterium sp.]|nr:hypothetical protein [Flavobacterium sp.]MBE98732.1 hypothetical protein [Flavobacterium sp.]|tara:strand:+ start:10679 stop:11164 length:486 start_codon:yes stop_codon:yes gene_type:complete